MYAFLKTLTKKKKICEITYIQVKAVGSSVFSQNNQMLFYYSFFPLQVKQVTEIQVTHSWGPSNKGRSCYKIHKGNKESKSRYDATMYGDMIKASTDNTPYQLPKMIKQKLGKGRNICQTQALRPLKGTVKPQEENHD